MPKKPTVDIFVIDFFILEKYFASFGCSLGSSERLLILCARIKILTVSTVVVWMLSLVANFS